MIKSVLGYGPVTRRIYWGKINDRKPEVWVGSKKDVTSNFIHVLVTAFCPAGSVRPITVDGKVEAHVFTVSNTKDSMLAAAKKLTDMAEELSNEVTNGYA